MPIRPENKACAHCGGDFVPYRGRRDVRFCSTLCKKRWTYAAENPRLVKACANCGDTFTPAGSNKAIHCSEACRAAKARASLKADPVRRESARASARRYSKSLRYRISQINHKARRRQAEREGNVTPEQWEARLEEFGHQCAYCPSLGPLTMDHVIALSRGGKHEIGNIVPACQPCNSTKNNETWVPRCP